MADEKDSKYALRIQFTQETEDTKDSKTLVEEFSNDPVIHVIKTKIFTEKLTKAINEITQELCDIALGELGGGKSKK